MNLNFDYVFNSWKQHMENTASNTVLSDSLGHSLKRSDCDEISARVYAWLKSQGVGAGDCVLINLDRGVKPVLAAMGVWKNGSAFTIVESTYAKDRIAYIRQDCNAAIEINEDNWQTILDVEPIEGFVKAGDHDICMMVYTSGTTGVPKGVMHEYGQIKMEMISEQRPDGTWRENCDTKWGLVAPLNFVASLKIIVHFLYCGGHLHVLDYDTVKNSKKLNAYFFKNRINETFLSPSLIRLKGDDFGPFMQYIYTGAEPANDIYVKKAELNNTYTMSESFFTVCEYIIDKPYPIVPIGKPMFDLDVKLVDENGNIVKEGERGELCYYNPYCRGYINNDVENKLHFVDGWFHTGDLAVYKDGVYTLKGRSDDMIKIDGNRIEPSEIEAACKDAIKLSACVAKGFADEGFVVLYYVGDAEFDEDEIRKKLEERLPYYMIPSYFVKIDKLPLNKSGKLDRKALSIPKTSLKAEYVAPRDDFETILCHAFEQVLGIENIGIKDDFFKLGGSSIKAIELIDYIDVDDCLSPSIIYKGRTVENISRLYKEASNSFMTEDEKEEEGRKHKYPISEISSLFWNDYYDCSLDFYGGVKILPIVSNKTLIEGINRYIDSNSTFNMVVEPDENGSPVQVFKPDKPYVELERMSTSEFEELKRTFIRRSKYGEPLIRIRVIRAGGCTNVLFHASHVVVDGASFYHMINDVKDCMLGKEVPRTNFFAYLLDENYRNSKDNYQENLEYFANRYFTKPRPCNMLADENTKNDGRGRTKPFGISLKQVMAYCDKHEISTNVFILAAILIAQGAYNRTDEPMVIWNYNNRSKNTNRGGVFYRSSICDLNLNEMSSIDSVFESIENQNQENFWRLEDHDYYRAFSRAIKGPKMTVSYLEGWFTSELPFYLALVCRKIKLQNSEKVTRKTSTNTLLTVAHEHGKMTVSLSYSCSFVSHESASRFTSLLEKTMHEMLEGRMPSAL